MSFKTYETGWIPEFGRYAIIITMFQNPEAKYYAAGAFVFGLDEEPPFFKGSYSNYYFGDPVPEEWTQVDEACLYKEALGAARNIICQQTKNSDIYRSELEPSEYRFIVFAKIRLRYEDQLKEVANFWSELYKDLWESVLRFLKFNLTVRQSEIGLQRK